MADFSLAWNRKRLTWSKRTEREHWLLECVLLERCMLEGRPQQRIVKRLAGILEDDLDSAAGRDKFWHDARYKLGKLLRLNQSDRWQIEVMMAARIPKPVPTSAPTVRPSAHPIRGPHQPLQRALRAR
jgi:hypothetical protein